MPRGDRTGPAGMGQMTGRGAGYCAGFSAPGFVNRGAGFTGGFGRGAGRGWNRGTGTGLGTRMRRGWNAVSPGVAYDAPAQPDQASTALVDRLDAIEKRLAKIESAN